MLTQERLKELFNYDPETGLFTRLVKTNKRMKIGDVAGWLNEGYIQIGIDYKVYSAHRLAFLYMTGKFPDVHVDHRDTIRHHNWWSNIRDATSRQNNENLRKAKGNNKSTGLLGSYPNKNSRTFYAEIMVKGKPKRLGNFKTAEEAHQAYLKAKRELHEFNTL